MLSGLSLQCLAYVMVAVAVALLHHAPYQVSETPFSVAGSRLINLSSGVSWPSRFSFSITQLSVARGEWFLGSTKPR